MGERGLNAYSAIVMDTFEFAAKRDMDDHEQNLRRDIESLRADVKRDIELLRAEVKKDLAETKAELIRWVVGVGVLQTTLVVAIIARLAKII